MTKQRKPTTCKLKLITNYSSLVTVFYLLYITHYSLLFSSRYTIYFFLIILHTCPKFLHTFKKILFIFKNKKGNGLSLLKPLPFSCNIFYILSAGRTRTRWARTARAWAWTHRGWSLTGADSKTIKNSFDILALTFYTGYFTFFHLFDSCSNLKSFMAVLTFKIIVWHRNFSFLFILFLSTLFSIFIYTPNYPFCQALRLIRIEYRVSSIAWRFIPLTLTLSLQGERE